MVLPPEEVKRFYRIWWALLSFVNVQREIAPDFSPSSEKSVSATDAFEVRTVLWEDDTLREEFIAQNPARLSKEDLEIVASWKHRLEGTFYIIRNLKKYSVFLNDQDPPQAYAVLGLVSSFDEFASYLPVMVKAVLLPFKGQIIYDSLLIPYNITFGSGFRASLNQAYKDVQEREGIITSLPAEATTSNQTKASVQGRNKKLLKEFEKGLYQSGLLPSTVQQHLERISAFVNSYLLEQTPPRLLIELRKADVQSYLESQTLTEKTRKDSAKSFKRLIRFLFESGRMATDTAYNFQEYLKGFK